MIPRSAITGDSYELLPFESALTEAAAVSRPLQLTVTCSPRQGNEAAIAIATQLRALGHRVATHLAVRLVIGSGHLDDLLGRLSDGGLDEVFLVGGDQARPAGPYRRALDLLAELRAHRLAPSRVGIPGYPEGHPLIPEDVLAEDLREKARDADYIVSQMCFDADQLVRWVGRVRADGVWLPLRIGVPGVVDGTRLLEISIRIGVGGSLSFLRKNRGARRLIRGDVAARMLDATRPLVGGELGIVGLHLYTFNRLVDTVQLTDAQDDEQTVNHQPPSAGPLAAWPSPE